MPAVDTNGASPPGVPSPNLFFINATIITGRPAEQPFISNVYVAGGQIVEISSELNPGDYHWGTRRVDAEGLVLCPGFVDMHAHSDLKLLTEPEHLAKVSQGCTTELIGQDGLAYAPMNDNMIEQIRKQTAGWNGNPTAEEEAEFKKKGVKGLFEGWSSVAGYLKCLEDNGVATNVAMLVPQGNLRMWVGGNTNAPLDRAQMRHMQSLLLKSLMEGAIGLSSGLTYPPGMYASKEELIELVKVLKLRPGTFYAPHHRSYGHKALDGYMEMLHIALLTKVPIHLTHATMNFPENRGRARYLLRAIDSSRKRGADVSLDTYPYLPGCTTLGALLPSWATAGGPDATLERLSHSETREKIRVAVEENGCDGGHGVPTDWTTIQVGTCKEPSISQYSSRLVSAIADEENLPPIEVFLNVLMKEKLAASCIMHVGNEENVQEIMKHPTHCGGSDAILHGDSIHPRAFGTFPRFIGHYARNLGLMSMVEMVSHLTYRPAKRMNIYPKRGVLAIGSVADLVLFDPRTIIDTATFESPKQVCHGIKMVVVNGVVVCEDGVTTGKRPGKVMRRPDTAFPTKVE